MQKGQTHPAALLSKNMLANGLLQLLKEKPYEKITIVELCDCSQIARRTFYRNFNSIDEVLMFYTNEVIENFVMTLEKYNKAPYGEIITAYFSFWQSQADFLKLMSQNDLISMVFTEYIKHLIDLPYLCTPNIPTDIPNAFACQFSYTLGGLWSLLTYWINNDCQQTPKELAQIVGAL